MSTENTKNNEKSTTVEGGAYFPELKRYTLLEHVYLGCEITDTVTRYQISDNGTAFVQSSTVRINSAGQFYFDVSETKIVNCEIIPPNHLQNTEKLDNDLMYGYRLKISPTD